jgi:replication-associated recombination protein RarA
VTVEVDPWVDVLTAHGLAADQVISALQKEIRRANAENAALLAYEMVLTSPALEDYLWQRLTVISVEDIGFGDPSAAVLVDVLRRMSERFERSSGERALFALHAVRYLCRCSKDRSSDEMLNWIIHAVEHDRLRPTIPDYALDQHTAAGRAMGRGARHFHEHGAKLAPELPDRDTTYRDRITALLDEGERGDDD